MSRILITGANGQLGRRLLPALTATTLPRALVRSERAKKQLARHLAEASQAEVLLADPLDAGALGGVLEDCDAVVHLIGTIRDSANSRLVDSHTSASRALLKAIDGMESPPQHLIYLSILGADATSNSECLRLRAEVENDFAAHAVPSTVIRVPMVLGEGDRASRALSRRAQQNLVLTLRAQSLEQPIYVGDVIKAIMAALMKPPTAHRCYELAGPESVSRRALITRAAATLKLPAPRIISLPLIVGLAAAQLAALVSQTPRISADMLKILDHDDNINAAAAARELGIELTPLDECLARCISR